MRCRSSAALQPFARTLAAAIDSDGRELFRECDKQPIDRGPTQMAVEVAESVAEPFGFALLAVFREQHMESLVDEAHSIECAGMDSTVRVPPRIAHFVDSLGELPDSRHIGKHRCSIRR